MVEAVCSRSARDVALQAVAELLAGGELDGAEDEAFWRDRAVSYIDAIQSAGIRLVLIDG